MKRFSGFDLSFIAIATFILGLSMGYHAEQYRGKPKNVPGEPVKYIPGPPGQMGLPGRMGRDGLPPSDEYLKKLIREVIKESGE